MHSTQNVGTIALPGSQLDIELHVNPLALSLSSSPRPPAHNQAAAATSGPSSSSRETTVVPTNKRKTNKSLKRKASVLYERPPPPPIPLPGPSEPIPSNFLRNQSALLGTAGLVGNVKTSNLSTPRGTSSNPIVIDDELSGDERHAPKRRKLSNGAPTPSNAEIVHALLKDKEVLPLLHELLVLFARGAFAKQSRVPEELNRKKVKLDSIPAGAGDWNVDFGRENDMPRCKYLLSQLMTHIRSATRKAAIKSYWFRINGKDSDMSESTDAPKVFGHYRPATLHYPATTGQEPTLQPFPPAPIPPASSPSDLAYPSSPSSLQYPSSPAVLVDVSNESLAVQPEPKSASYSHPSQSSSLPSLRANNSLSLPPSSNAPQTQANVLDELVGSLLSASESPSSNLPTLETLLSDTSAATTSPDVEQWVMDTWLPIFESLPVSAEDFGRLDVGGLQSSSPAPDFPMNFDFSMLEQSDADTTITPNAWDDSPDHVLETFSIPKMIAAPVASQPGSTSPLLDDSPTSISQPRVVVNVVANNGDSFENSVPHWRPPPDSAIDPALLAQSARPASSAPPPAQTAGASTASRPLAIHIDTNLKDYSAPPSLVASPMPSMSSFGDVELLTPSTTSWELPDIAQPDVVSAPGPNRDEGGLTQGKSRQQGMSRRAIMNNRSVYQRFGTDVMDIAKEAEKNANVGEVLPALISALFPSVRKVKVAQPVPVGPVQNRKLSKIEIMKEVHARRALLADANIMARTKLWEVTIEHAVLSQMAQQYKCKKV